MYVKCCSSSALVSGTFVSLVRAVRGLLSLGSVARLHDARVSMCAETGRGSTSITGDVGEEPRPPEANVGEDAQGATGGQAVREAAARQLRGLRETKVIKRYCSLRLALFYTQVDEELKSHVCYDLEDCHSNCTQVKNLPVIFWYFSRLMSRSVGRSGMDVVPVPPRCDSSRTPLEPLLRGKGDQKRKRESSRIPSVFTSGQTKERLQEYPV